MNKNLRKSYECLELKFDATVEEIEARHNALVKIYKSKEAEKNISLEKDIEKVDNATKLILDNIKNNGIPSEEYHCYEAETSSVIGLLAVLGFVSLMCFFSFYMFL